MTDSQSSGHQSSEDSECSGVELSMECDSMSSTGNVFQKGPNEQQLNRTGEVCLEEPKFSDSSSCAFSFEYLREDSLQDRRGCKDSYSDLSKYRHRTPRSAFSSVTNSRGCERRLLSPTVQWRELKNATEGPAIPRDFWTLRKPSAQATGLGLLTIGFAAQGSPNSERANPRASRPSQDKPRSASYSRY